jgi:DNA-binding LacI/PurR family transcriptional regulator
VSVEPPPAAEPGRAPTIVDVAALAGVSKSLVSLVMRNSSKVSPTRREAVLRAAAELGYRPNGLARRLVQGRTQTMAVLVKDLSNPFFVVVRQMKQQLMAVMVLCEQMLQQMFSKC